MPNYLLDVTPTMNDMENHNVVFFNAINHNVAPDCHTPQSSAQVVAPTPRVRMFG